MKAKTYRQAGVEIIWIINTYDWTMSVCRKANEPIYYNRLQRLPEDPLMPGFTPTVAELIDWNSA